MIFVGALLQPALAGNVEHIAPLLGRLSIASRTSWGAQWSTGPHLHFCGSGHRTTKTECVNSGEFTDTGQTPSECLSSRNSSKNPRATFELPTSSSLVYCPGAHMAARDVKRKAASDAALDLLPRVCRMLYDAGGTVDMLPGHLPGWSGTSPYWRRRLLWLAREWRSRTALPRDFLIQWDCGSGPIAAHQSQCSPPYWCLPQHTSHQSTTRTGITLSFGSSTQPKMPGCVYDRPIMSVGMPSPELGCEPLAITRCGCSLVDQGQATGP